MGDLGSLLAGIAAILSCGISVWTVLRTTPRRSDKESERAAVVAVEAAQQPDNVTVIKPDGKADER